MPKRRRYLSDTKPIDKGYSVKGSPANNYTAFGQILNSINPYTAVMNASRNVNEYQKNLDTQAQLGYYAKLPTMPIMMASGISADMMWPVVGVSAAEFIPELTSTFTREPKKEKRQIQRRIGIEY